MKKILIILLIIQSCSSKKKEYHDNGKLKKIYSLKNNNYDGIYEEYFDNGKLKEKHKFREGVFVDSSFLYSSQNNNLEIKIWKQDSTHYSIVKNEKGEIIREGRLSNDNPLKRLGIWKFHNINGTSHDSIIEYVNVNGKSYSNQSWVIKGKDTLVNRGNYYKLFIKDREGAKMTKRFDFELIRPYFSYESEVFVVLPRTDEELNDDFSNFEKIERDTFPSLKNDGIPHSELSDLNNKNNIIIFASKYSKPGKKKIKGALIEKIKNENDKVFERRLFFDKYFEVK